MIEAFVIAFLSSVVLHYGAIHFFPRWGLLDFPERYGFKRKRLPYPTGILAIILFLIFFFVLDGVTMQSAGLGFGVLTLGVFAFLDDRIQLSSSLRLTLQFVVFLLIFATGSRIYSLTNPVEFLTGISIIKLDMIDIPRQFSVLSTQFAVPFAPLPIWSGVFTVVWLLLTTNALNWFDGIPGQVSLLSLIGFFTIGFLSLSARVDQPELAVLAFVLAGIACGSLVFDFPPPKLLMGDSGAMFFGLMLGVLTIYSGGKVATAFLVLGVPLIDSLFVIAHRLFKGHSPFRGSLHGEHLHHRLLDKGWKPRQIILLTAGLGLAFGVTALFLSTMEKFFAALLLFCVMGVLWWYTSGLPSGRQEVE